MTGALRHRELPCQGCLVKAAASSFRRPPMLAIAAIAIFLAVMAVLNRIDFGRFD